MSLYMHQVTFHSCFFHAARKVERDVQINFYLSTLKNMNTPVKRYYVLRVNCVGMDYCVHWITGCFAALREFSTAGSIA